jgi:hypothetical protein
MREMPNMSCPMLPATGEEVPRPRIARREGCVLRECIEALASFREPTIEELSNGTMH